MEFIKNNLFYVVLVGAVVVGGGVIVAMAISVNGTVDDELIPERGSVDQAAAAQARKPARNEWAVGKEKERVEKIQSQNKQVEGATRKWNEGDHPMFMGMAKDKKTGALSEFPAFQVDRKVEGKFTMEEWRKWKAQQETWQGEVYDQHTAAYREMLEKIFQETWRIATPPSSDALYRLGLIRARRLKEALEAKRRQEEIQAKKAEAEARAAAEKAGGGAVPKAVDPSEVRRMHVMMTARGETPEVQAAREAGEELSIRQSGLGWVYGGVDDTRPIVGFAPVLQAGGRERLWKAWIHTRVVRDVARAARGTVAEVLGGRGKTEQEAAAVLAAATVPDSPIKRLMEIRIHQEGLPYAGGTPTYGAGGGGGGGMRGIAVAGGATGADKGTAATLTGRVTNQQYDVIRYEVELLMDERYVGVFQNQLCNRNDHTVLLMQWQRLSAGGGPARLGPAPAERDLGREGGAPAASSDSSLYYYGNGPVALVTIEVELLMRADWTRALMPEEVLTEIRQAIPGAMRREDNDRLTQYSSYRASVGRMVP